MKDNRIAVSQAAVSRDGEILYEEAFGLANLEQKIQATTRTMFLIGSITKPITSTALTIMAERVLIDPQRLVNEYINES